jgi:hypothetical protein
VVQWLRTCHLEKNMYNTIPNETDLDTFEYFFQLEINANALLFLMYHYIDLRLEQIDGTPGLPPEQALHETMQWATDVRLIEQPACIA